MLLVAKEKDMFTSDFIRGFMDCLLELEKDGEPYRVTLAVGRSHRRMEHVPEAFNQVLHAARDRHILKGKGWKAVYASDSLPKKEEKNQVVLPTDTFLHHIRMGMVEEVEQDIKNIYEPFRQIGRASCRERVSA